MISDKPAGQSWTGPGLFKIRVRPDRRKLHKKHTRQQASAQYLLLVLQASARHIVQATGGESGQLTCHAPVTFRSVELDFLVGTENPIRLLYSAAPLTPDKTKQGVPDWENGFCRLFSLFGGQCCEIKGRFYLWQQRGLDYRWTGGRGRAVNCAVRGRDWLAAVAYTCSGGGTEALVEQGWTLAIMSAWDVLYREKFFGKTKKKKT